MNFLKSHTKQTRLTLPTMACCFPRFSSKASQHVPVLNKSHLHNNDENKKSSPPSTPSLSSAGGGALAVVVPPASPPQPQAAQYAVANVIEQQEQKDQFASVNAMRSADLTYFFHLNGHMENEQRKSDLPIAAADAAAAAAAAGELEPRNMRSADLTFFFHLNGRMQE